MSPAALGQLEPRAAGQRPVGSYEVQVSTQHAPYQAMRCHARHRLYLRSQFDLRQPALATFPAAPSNCSRNKKCLHTINFCR